MKTEILTSSDEDISRAAAILKNGGLVAIPTETVYGLAANAYDGVAVEKIFAAKGRPQDNPLIVHISEMSQLDGIVTDFPESAKRLADEFWCGPLTMILPRDPKIPDVVSCSMPTVAVRMPSHPVARAIISAAGVPLAAPSANLSGSPSPTRAKHVIDDMLGRIDAVVDGGECEFGVESTVVTLCGEVPRLLRPGGISLEELIRVLGECEMDKAVLAQLEPGQKAASPGMKYKHYSPKASVIIVKGSHEAFADYVNQAAREGDMAICFDGEEQKISVQSLSVGRQEDLSAQAHRLFDCLRRVDEMSAKTVYAHCPSTEGIGLAVYNRLLRAAAFRVIEV